MTRTAATRTTDRSLRLLGSSLLVIAASTLTGCSTADSVTAAPQTNVQQYFGPAVSAIPASGSNPGVGAYLIDHTAGTFVQYAGNKTVVYDSGTFTTLGNGIESIALTYSGGNGSQGALLSPPQTGSWAVEWSGQGALIGMLGQPVTPVASNATCPSLSTATAFEFVTLPTSGNSTEVAYGTLNIASTGTAINFTGIAQYTLSGGVPVNPSAATVSGTCSSTVLGQTISVPNTSVVSNPGNGQLVAPSATIAIGPTGFLVEDNGGGDNIMGGGTGAVGLPVPAAALTTSTLTGAQYTGFIFGTGAAGNNLQGLAAVSSSSRVASFGYPNLATACPTLPAPQTATILYGGEFASNNPAGNAFGNCDFAIDFGTQSTKTNGLFPSAVVWIGASYPGNATGKSYSFPAVAIASQLKGKNAIFVIGLDATGLKTISQGRQSQDWGVYLLQSN